MGHRGSRTSLKEAAPRQAIAERLAARLAGWRSVRPLASAGAIIALLGGAVWGLERLKAQVYARPEFQPTVRLELTDAPAWLDREGWTPRILESVDIDGVGAGAGPAVREVHDRLMASGWIDEVHQIAMSRDGRMSIRCSYRRPVAMVHFEGAEDEPIREGFVPIDKQGIRLPEVYSHVDEESMWLRIFGVESPLPEVGQPFTAEDGVAAVKLAALIGEQEFAPAISAINVRNLDGRRNPNESHIVLLTREWGRIKWGSPIGEEVEEPRWDQKIKTVASYFRRGTPQIWIDVSVYPDRWIEPVEPAMRTPGGVNERS